MPQKHCITINRQHKVREKEKNREIKTPKLFALSPRPEVREILAPPNLAW